MLLSYNKKLFPDKCLKNWVSQLTEPGKTEVALL